MYKKEWEFLKKILLAFICAIGIDVFCLFVVFPFVEKFYSHTDVDLANALWISIMFVTIIFSIFLCTFIICDAIKKNKQ